MEQFTVPLMVLVGGVIGWCAWLTLRVFGAEKDIAVNTSNDLKVSTQIAELKTDMNQKIDKMETNMANQFDKVFEKIDELRR